MELLDEAIRLVEVAAARGVTVRLLGGLGFRAKVPGWVGRTASAQPDIDLVVAGSDRAGLTALMVESGYAADRRHNALHGDRQLYFAHPEIGHSVDVMVDRLVMCHTLDLRGRLGLDSPTLTAADLLLSKLQVVQLNEKDAIDLLALLSAYPLAQEDRGGISIGRVLSITARDWGWWRTATGNLHALEEFIHLHGDGHSPVMDGERLSTAAHRVAQLQSLLGDAPKSPAWRLRALVGERVRWYDEPEEVGHTP